jgi:hypothetical protein
MNKLSKFILSGLVCAVPVVSHADTSFEDTLASRAVTRGIPSSLITVNAGKDFYDSNDVAHYLPFQIYMTGDTTFALFKKTKAQFLIAGDSAETSDYVKFITNKSNGAYYKRINRSVSLDSGVNEIFDLILNGPASGVIHRPIIQSKTSVASTTTKITGIFSLDGRKVANKIQSFSNGLYIFSSQKNKASIINK